MRSRSVLVAVMTVCALAFTFLAILVAGHLDPFAVDRAALELAEDLQSPGLTAVMRTATALGSTPGVIITMSVVGLAILIARRDSAPSVWMSTAATGALVLYEPLKAIIGRARPPDGLVDATREAFPSGHATQGVAFFGMLAVVLMTSLRGPVRVWAAATTIFLGLLSGVSRIYLEVHWLTDVLGGFLLGSAWLCALLLLKGIAVKGPGSRKRVA